MMLLKRPDFHRWNYKLRELLYKLKLLYQKAHKNPKDYLLAIARLTTATFTTFAILAMLIPQLETDSSDMSVLLLDTSTVDIFAGLYKTVGSSLTSGDLDFGQTLSTSQIIAITNVTTSMLIDTPDYVTSGLYNTCLHYTYRWKFDPNMENLPDDGKAQPPPDAQKLSPFDKDSAHLVTERTVCSRSTLYDYREILYDNFEVLANILFTVSDSAKVQEESDNQYDQWKQPRENLLHTSTLSLVIAYFVQLGLLILTVVFYILLKKKADPQKIKIIGNVIAIGSIFIFILTGYSTLTMVLVLSDFKSRIHNELSSFKIALHLCVGFFALLWSVLISTLITMGCWAMPVWCQTPPEIEDDEQVTEELYEISETDHLVRTYTTDAFDGTTFRIPSSTLSSSKDEDDLPKSLFEETDVLIDVPFKDPLNTQKSENAFKF